MLAKALGKICG